MNAIIIIINYVEFIYNIFDKHDVLLTISFFANDMATL